MSVRFKHTIHNRSISSKLYSFEGVAADMRTQREDYDMDLRENSMDNTIDAFGPDRVRTSNAKLEYVSRKITYVDLHMFSKRNKSNDLNFCSNIDYNY